MIALKPGVRLDNLTPQMILAVIVVRDAMLFHAGVGTIITSANDGTHKNGSLHSSGNALDFRTKHAAVSLKPEMVNAIRGALGPNYDVILEGANTENEHLHVEYQPKLEKTDETVTA